ncbi:ABC transporter ATP-binding protein [Acidisphaera sp. S103]|uniref:ABC transporter ATP-binding protein n=1 Tax=Acidisphaera sp. S103 TaxID=1747223 RepID=UPI0020B10A83|nr:ABC transporter ATP-binding protein [Acidisphaera sp. S103]
MHDVSLDVAPGEFVALLGPSGCGKTTTLRMVAGFVPPSAGAVFVGDADVTRLPPERRDIGMVFQNYALFPHMTVRANIEFGLKCHRLARAERVQRTADVIDLVGLGTMADRYPRQLSGGQQQRVALARVMALRPRLLLFDEPLSNLDAKLREQMRDEILRLQRQSGVTALFVTHDRDEAMTMADRIVVMSKGRVEQVGTPADIYDHPCTRFVADFIGAANFFEGAVEGPGDCRVFRCRGGHVLPLPTNAPSATTLAVRPERIAFVAPTTDGALAGIVTRVRHVASVIEYLVTLPSGEVVSAQVQRRHAVPQFCEGEAVAITWPPADSILLPS